MNSDPAVMRYFPARLTREESDAAVDRIKEMLARRGFTLYAAEFRDMADFIGFIGLWVPSFMDVVEIGWRLAPAWWNRGLATEGSRAVLRHAFADLGLDEVVAFTVPANFPSRRVMEKIGMTHDPSRDFDHPKIAAGHPLRRHLLYRIGREA
jgi:RimJ/RimL family protein N-acetyltransferase